MELLLMLFSILTPMCMNLANTELAEYGPVNEIHICKIDHIQTTDCNTIELDFFNNEFCCRKCPDGQQNSNPEKSNSCSDIPEQPMTELETTIVKPSTTTSQTETPTIARTTAPYLPDDQTTPSPEETTTEQAVIARDEIDPPPVTNEKLPGSTIAWIVVGVIIGGILLAVLAVHLYRRNNRLK
uniref:uncharacterized protein LOC120328490 n=1 Tax=Styela clava TaxID=7725 RepID=UPI00193A90CE|nr:uncharacterized protein LOC120328490 [Styela clava]